MDQTEQKHPAFHNKLYIKDHQGHLKWWSSSHVTVWRHSDWDFRNSSSNTNPPRFGSWWNHYGRYAVNNEKPKCPPVQRSMVAKYVLLKGYLLSFAQNPCCQEAFFNDSKNIRRHMALHGTWHGSSNHPTKKIEVNYMNNKKRNIHVFQLLNHLAQDVDARNAPFCYFVDFRGQLGQLCHFGETPLPRPKRTLARMPYTDWRFSHPRCRCIHSSTWTNFSRILDQHL